MQFRGSGQRDDRRRRILRDETEQRAATATDSAADPDPASSSHSASYSGQARRRCQPRFVDLIPKRLGTLIILLVGMIGLSLAFGWLEYVFSDPSSGPARVLLRPSAPGGLDDWFLSVLLLGSGLVGCQILSMRQFRSNDYRGTYQVWSWLSVLLIFLSMDSIAGVSQLLNLLLQSAWPLQIHTQPLAWSTWILHLLCAAAIARGLMEVKKSRWATTLAILSGLTYTLSLYAPWWTELVPSGWSLVGSTWPAVTLMMLGHSFLLVGMTSFARFVYLEANGLMAVSQQASERIVRNEQRRQEKLESRAQAKQAKAEAAAARKRRKAEKEAEAQDAKAQRVDKRAQQKKTTTEDAATEEPIQSPESAKTTARTSKRAGKQATKARTTSRSDNSQATTQDDQATPHAAPNRKKRETGKAGRSEISDSTSAKPLDDSPGLRVVGSEQSPAEPVSSMPSATSLPMDDEELLAELGIGQESSSRSGMSKAERRRQRKSARKAQRRAA